MKKILLVLVLVALPCGRASWAEEKPVFSPVTTATALAERTQVIPIDIHVTQTPPPAPAAAETAVAPIPQWERLITSPIAAALLAIAAGFFLSKYTPEKRQNVLDEAARWKGIVTHVYNAAEEAGILNGWSGRQKLAHAVELFDTVFQKTYKVLAKPGDVNDLKLDLAVMAKESPTSAELVAAGTAVPHPEVPQNIRGVAELVRSTS